MTKSAITPPISKPSSNYNREAIVKSKELKEALNQNKTEEATKPSQPHSLEEQQENGGDDLVSKSVVTAEEEQKLSIASTPQEDEKTDEGTEKESLESESAPAVAPPKPKSRSGSKEGSIVRELAPASLGDNNDAMTASMIAKSKITTEEEAKAALAERRRLAREEAERQAELERQRLEAERLAELKRQEEEAERQRLFEEEAMRMAEEQRKAEDERLRQAIEVRN